MGTIDEIEIYLKSQISYYHSQKYDAEGYTDSTNYYSGIWLGMHYEHSR
jgi:abortive infection bacteriophage resistance protein